jgi:hypothetical protein
LFNAAGNHHPLHRLAMLAGLLHGLSVIEETVVNGDVGAQRGGGKALARISAVWGGRTGDTGPAATVDPLEWNGGHCGLGQLQKGNVGL